MFAAYMLLEDDWRSYPKVTVDFHKFITKIVVFLIDGKLRKKYV